MNTDSDTFAIGNTTRTKTPPQARSLFPDIKRDILGASYRLSLVFIGSTRSRNLNRTYCGKDKPGNVLSFPLEKNVGEIFIDLGKARKDAHRFQKGYNEFVTYVFIHGCLHLKGMDHGDAMERAEDRYMDKWWKRR
ncbi:MAG: rRNA maturation RNase YbeY [Parcubacteria group bacterium]|nr:rRNA maturation RNase YbeY [Parcubacteria group bacterium]